MNDEFTDNDGITNVFFSDATHQSQDQICLAFGANGLEIEFLGGDSDLTPYVLINTADALDDMIAVLRRARRLIK